MSQHGCPERLSNRSKGFQEDGAAQATMEVLVETLTGTAFEMTVSPSDTIFAIKSKICRVEGIPVSQQHLVYNLRELEDCASLAALGICDGARLRLVLGMRGGPVSSRRLPPPEPWPRPDSREDGDWGGRCRVTVVVFRDGERLNMLRVTENPDGTYSPLEHNYSSPLSPPSPASGAAEAGAAGALAQNAVTMGKMLELRRRMESLQLRRRHDDQPELQKTRSEESLPRELDDDLAYAPLLDGDYTRYEYSCVDRYTLLPPLAPPAPPPHADTDRLKLSDALAGSILVAGGEGGARGEDECRLQPPPPDHHYGPLAGAGWRRAFGSHSQLAAAPAPAPLAAAPHARSASSLSVRGVLPAPLPALLSASAGDLEALRRRRAPALARHRNTELLHLSDDALHQPRHRHIHDIAEADARHDEDREEKKEKKTRLRCGFCRKKLSIATVHRCRCGAAYCAPHRYAEVHGCAYDYRAPPAAARPARPARLQAPKLPKI